MPNRLSGLLLALLLLVTGTPVADAADGVRTITLDHVAVAWRSGTTQVITVNRTYGTHARISFWLREQGSWVRVMRSVHARIGYGGLVAGSRRRQGSGTTPLGTYRLLSTFGTGPVRAGWEMPYRQIGAHDYWVEDNASAYYNRYRSRDLGGFRWWLDPNTVNGSERLANYPREYAMSVVTSYNYAARIRYRGAGIFLHVNGPGPTAGCVSAPYWFLAGVMRRLDPRAHPLIAIGR